jgi:hypothetical protein
MNYFSQADKDGLKKFLYCLFCSLTITLSVFSQNAGISSAGLTSPHSAAGLDINFTDKGFLIPRVALTDTDSSLPIPFGVAGMVIYNTATSGDVTPGIYFNDGTKWIQVTQKAFSAGDMQYWDGTTWKIIAAGQPGQKLQISSSGVPAWVGAGYASLVTSVVTGITSDGAVTGGTISIDGGSPVTSRGVCWDIGSNPTIANSKTSDSSGTGSFVSIVTGLITGSTYYLRAYATNNAGTSYGNLVVFTAL